MVRPMAIGTTKYDCRSIPLAITLFICITALVALCAKHANRVAKKSLACELKTTPKKLLTTTPSNKKKGGAVKAVGCDDHQQGGFGEEGGLWQKTILMGEKCQPPEFSGVIFYDNAGRRVYELPRSPRASPLPSFSFPVVKE